MACFLNLCGGGMAYPLVCGLGWHFWNFTLHCHTWILANVRGCVAYWQPLVTLKSSDLLRMKMTVRLEAHVTQECDQGVLGPQPTTMAQEFHRNVVPKKNNLADVLSLLKAGSCSYHLVQDFFQHYCMPSLNDPMSFLCRMDDPIRQSRSQTDDKPVLCQSQQVQVCAKKHWKPNKCVF